MWYLPMPGTYWSHGRNLGQFRFAGKDVEKKCLPNCADWLIRVYRAKCFRPIQAFPTRALSMKELVPGDDADAKLVYITLILL